MPDRLRRLCFGGGYSHLVALAAPVVLLVHVLGPPVRISSSAWIWLSAKLITGQGLCGIAMTGEVVINMI